MERNESMATTNDDCGGRADAMELLTVDQLAEISQNPDPVACDLAEHPGGPRPRDEEERDRYKESDKRIPRQRFRGDRPPQDSRGVWQRVLRPLVPRRPVALTQIPRHTH